MTKEQRARMARGRQRWATLNRFVDGSMRRLSSTACCVWFALFRHANALGRVQCSQAQLAAQVGVDPRRVRAALRELEEAGVCTRIKRGGPGRGPNGYVLSGRFRPQDGNDPIGADEIVRSHADENSRHYKQEDQSEIGAAGKGNARTGDAAFPVDVASRDDREEDGAESASSGCPDVELPPLDEGDAFVPDDENMSNGYDEY